MWLPTLTPYGCCWVFDESRRIWYLIEQRDIHDVLQQHYLDRPVLEPFRAGRAIYAVHEGFLEHFVASGDRFTKLMQFAYAAASNRTGRRFPISGRLSMRPPSEQELTRPSIDVGTEMDALLNVQVDDTELNDRLARLLDDLEMTGVQRRIMERILRSEGLLTPRQLSEPEPLQPEVTVESVRQAIDELRGAPPIDIDAGRLPLFLRPNVGEQVRFEIISTPRRPDWFFDPWISSCLREGRSPHDEREDERMEVDGVESVRTGSSITSYPKTHIVDVSVSADANRWTPAQADEEIASWNEVLGREKKRRVEK